MASEPRVFFAALMPLVLREPLWRAMCAHSLHEKLDDKQLFVPENWHQTLSGRHFSPSAEQVERLREAGTRIKARAFAMVINRIGGSGGIDAATGTGKFHWEFRVRGTPDGFAELQAAVQRGLATVGLADGEGHRPHVTLSYGAPFKLPTKMIEPVEWLVDEIQLVEGGGSPYRYRVIDRWPLAPKDQAPGAQLSMF